MARALLLLVVGAASGFWSIDPRLDEQSVASALKVIADGGRNLAMEAVAAGRHDHEALRFSQDPPNLGYPRQAYWIRLDLANVGDIAKDRLLVLWRGAGQKQLFLITGNGVARLAKFGQDSDRIGDIVSRHQVLRLHIPAHSRISITGRIESRVSLVLDYRLFTAEGLARRDALDYGFFGVLFGAVVAIGIFVLMVWFAMRERIFLWFCGFAFSILLYQLHAESYIYIFLGPNWQVPGSYVGAYAGAVQSICLVLLMRDFIASQVHVPHLDRYLVRPLVLLLSMVFWLFPIEPWLGNTAVAIAVVVTGVSLVALVVVGLWRRWLTIWVFFTALMLYWIAAVLYLLKRIGFIPDLIGLTIAQQLTTGMAVILFALAISAKLRAVAAENQSNQRRHAEQLELHVAERTRQYREATAHSEQALAHLRQAQRQLVQQEKMASLGTLVAGVAHEVNTPLGIALTASSFLAARSTEIATVFQSGALSRTGMTEYLGCATQSSGLIQRHLERAAQLIQSFKQVSVDRTSDGRRRFDLDVCINELIESLALTWKRRSITVHINCLAGISMDSYPGALGQVLTNLVQNALIHAFEPEQAGGIWVSAHRIDQHVELLFQDNGRGVSEEDLSRIFEPFFTTRRNQGGTGLGLHVAFNLIAQKLGGQVSVSSVCGEGLQFILSLPLVAP